MQSKHSTAATACNKLMSSNRVPHGAQTKIAPTLAATQTKKPGLKHTAHTQPEMSLSACITQTTTANIVQRKTLVARQPLPLQVQARCCCCGHEQGQKSKQPTTNKQPHHIKPASAPLCWCHHSMGQHQSVPKHTHIHAHTAVATAAADVHVRLPSTQDTALPAQHG